MKILYKSTNYDPHEVVARHVRADSDGKGYRYSEQNKNGRDILQAFTSGDDIPKTERKKADNLRGQAFGWVKLKAPPPGMPPAQAPSFPRG